MGSPKNLNEPSIYAEALVQAALEPDSLRLAAWLADDENVAQMPLSKWYLYLAERLHDLAPRPEQGFVVRPQHTAPTLKLGRNDPCPCGSGKKFKQCHLGKEASTTWKLGSPTPSIRNMAVVSLIHSLDIDTLDKVPLNRASALARSEMAAAYHRMGHGEIAVRLLKSVLDDDRDDSFMILDFWIARYAEWLVELDRPKEAEEFLLDEYDHRRGVLPWQVAQKLAAFYLDQGDTDNADTWIETSLKDEPNNPFSHYLRGLLRHELESWDPAIAAYEKALELSDQFRPQERAYMTHMVNASLARARDHLPIGELSPDTGSEGESDPATLINPNPPPAVPPPSESTP